MMPQTPKEDIEAIFWSGRDFPGIGALLPHLGLEAPAARLAWGVALRDAAAYMDSAGADALARHYTLCAPKGEGSIAHYYITRAWLATPGDYRASFADFRARTRERLASRRGGYFRGGHGAFAQRTVARDADYDGDTDARDGTTPNGADTQ